MRTGWIAVGLALICAAPACARGLAVRAAHIEQDTKLNLVNVSYPVTGVKAIDRDIAQDVAKLRKDYANTPDSGEDRAYSLDVSYRVLRNDGAMFVAELDIETDTGGAHPNHETRIFNYLMPDGWRVFLPEIVGHDGIARVSRLAIAALKRQNREDQFSDDDWIARGAGPEADNFRAFAWLPKRLRIVFDEYQVAAYAAGPQQVDIPLAALQGAIRADWRAPAASFDCARAQSDVERAICGDFELGRLDRALASAYRLKLGSLDGDAARTKLRADQRQWLARRAGACPGGAAGRTTGEAACLAALYRQRIARLSEYP